MHPNAQMIEEFYRSFGRQDAAGMIAHYHDEIEFTDPVFNLRGTQAKGMWQMLCARAKELTVTCSNVQADDTQGSAHWEATYLFSQTGRRVHNIIEARFEFKDGKIIKHRDTFDLWRWTSMALGPVGMLLGWTPIIQNKVRAQANQNLATFLEKQARPTP